MSIYCCIRYYEFMVIFTEFINVREGKRRARCVEQRREERGGRRDGVPEIDVMGRRERSWEGMTGHRQWAAVYR